MGTSQPPFDSTALGALARQLRLEQGLSQREVGEAVGGVRGERVTQQAVAQAESAATRADMTQLRIRIVEHLSGRRLAGPFWDWAPEAVGSSGEVVSTAEAPEEAASDGVLPQEGDGSGS